MLSLGSGKRLFFNAKPLIIQKLIKKTEGFSLKANGSTVYSFAGRPPNLSDIADCQRQPLHGLTLTQHFCRGALRASVPFNHAAGKFCRGVLWASVPFQSRRRNISVGAPFGRPRHFALAVSIMSPENFCRGAFRAPAPFRPHRFIHVTGTFP